jgi:hypothetical protein
VLAVTAEPVGEFELKGIRRPMVAYNVLGPKFQTKLMSVSDKVPR